MYLLFFAILVGGLLSLLDSTVSSFIVILLAILWGRLTNYKLKGRELNYGMILLGCVTIIYTISAFIISRNYSSNHFFLVSDALQYIRWLNLRSAEDNYTILILENYGGLLDKDMLHEVYARMVCIWGNNLLGGTSVFYLTLCHTVFGILAIASLYRIMLLYFDAQKAFKYALVFAVFSPFIYYSSVIIRDIVIAYCFCRGIEIIFKPYKRINYLWLFLYAFVAIGVRLYSGLFMLSFLLVYFIKSDNKKRRTLIVVAVLAILAFVAVSGQLVSDLYLQASDELERYQEFDAEGAAGGLSGRILALPPVIKQVAMFFYSQMMPFPSYVSMMKAQNITQAYEGLLYLVFPIWWYMVFFSFFVLYTLKEGYKKMPFVINIFIILAFVYILMNTAHIDIRRMMHIYPLFYTVSLLFRKEYFRKKTVASVEKRLFGGYVGLLLVYLVIK